MAGRTNTRRMHKGRLDFFLEGKELDAKGDPEANCWLCTQPIDYAAPQGSTDESHNLDHFKTVDEYPELQEDPSNWRHSHRLCNQKRGKDAPSPGLGQAVPDWW